MDYKIKRDSGFIKAIRLFFSISFFIAAFVATIYLDLCGHVWQDFFKIMTRPAPLVTDYFKLGNLASAFLNALISVFIAFNIFVGSPGIELILVVLQFVVLIT